ncbi:MAG: polysaccharide deacetylase family protein [Clostridia bacterium]|nr:polysaccharide deacetylase family protein [Clostridia bacterium]
MKNLNRNFALLVIVILAALTAALYFIPELPSLTAWNYAVELTGPLSEGSENVDTPEYLASSLEDTYSGLRSWGIARGKNGEFPRADPGAPELIAKYQSLYIGDKTKNKIYLTFDEGYENGYTSKILDVLSENKVNAIFFITGPYLDKHDDLVKRMLDEGHAVGNHTINHKSLPLLDDRELEQEIVGLDSQFFEKFGKNMVYLRAPKGEYSERTLELTAKMGYVNVFWSFAYDDWAVNRQRGWQYAFDKVKNNLHNGEILLLHAVSKDNADALDAIIKYAREAGYEFGDVFELERLARGEMP